MPLGIGISVHDDSKHTGNAKRETANGLAGLDGSAELIARLAYENVANGVAGLDASAEIIIRLAYEGVANGVAGLDGSAEIIARLAYENVANGVAGLDGSAEIIARLAYENVANGVAGLDATGRAPYAQLPSNVCSITKLDYVGNDTVNRAIAHLLPSTAKLALISRPDTEDWYRILIPGGLHSMQPATADYVAVTAPDGTNIYVGNAASYPHSANANGVAYHCVVFS